jgi:hypothetical protein
VRSEPKGEKKKKKKKKKNEILYLRKQEAVGCKFGNDCRDQTLLFTYKQVRGICSQKPHNQSSYFLQQQPTSFLTVNVTLVGSDLKKNRRKDCLERTANRI